MYKRQGLVNLPVYGTSEARRALLMEVVELLAADGYLAITEGKFPLVGFGPRYREAAEPDVYKRQIRMHGDRPAVRFCDT